MPQKKIKYTFLEAAHDGKPVPVVRIFYGAEETEITVAFAANKRLPLLPIEQSYDVVFAALATSGRETIRVWSNEFVAGRELHNIDVSYPRIVREAP